MIAKKPSQEQETQAIKVYGCSWNKLSFEEKYEVIKEQEKAREQEVLK